MTEKVSYYSLTLKGKKLIKDLNMVEKFLGPGVSSSHAWERITEELPKIEYADFLEVVFSKRVKVSGEYLLQEAGDSTWHRSVGSYLLKEGYIRRVN